MAGILILNKLRWYWRLPVKWLVFGLILLVVCFPYPSLLVKHVEHWRDPNALIEPDAEALKPLVAELRGRMTPKADPKQALATVERFVLEKVRYDWDWNTWGMADYMPTVDEVLSKGKEDCDGRAVVAASLLRNFGFEAQIATDFSHVWVKTDKGETMGPGKRKAVVATKDGLRVSPWALIELTRGLAYGLAVFPLEREAILVIAAWFLMLGSSSPYRYALMAVVGLFGGLMLLRSGGLDYRHPIPWQQWGGVLLWIGAVAAVWIPRFGQQMTSKHVTKVCK